MNHARSQSPARPGEHVPETQRLVARTRHDALSVGGHCQVQHPGDSAAVRQWGDEMGVEFVRPEQPGDSAAVRQWGDSATVRHWGDGVTVQQWGNWVTVRQWGNEVE